MGWPSKLTDRKLKRDSLLMSCTSPTLGHMLLHDSYINVMIALVLVYQNSL